jgi:hypothetical protein
MPNNLANQFFQFDWHQLVVNVITGADWQSHYETQFALLFVFGFVLRRKRRSIRMIRPRSAGRTIKDALQFNRLLNRLTPRARIVSICRAFYHSDGDELKPWRTQFTL